MANSSFPYFDRWKVTPGLISLLMVVVGIPFGDLSSALASEKDALDHFEKRVRPLLIDRCSKCHGAEKQNGDFRVDSREALLRGGDLGPAIRPGKPDESRLIEAVQRKEELKMPPDEALNEMQVEWLIQWVRQGAVWPEADSTTGSSVGGDGQQSMMVEPIRPDDPKLKSSLQIWLSADSLPAADGDVVSVWPDRSGAGRDFAVTKGVRSDGTGEAPRYVAQSAIQKRPAVRFTVKDGLASSPDRPVEISGDAELTIVLVVNLSPVESNPPYDGIFGFGNPANPQVDPGFPKGALIQISRARDHELQLAGGWNHDAGLGPGSMKPWYGRSLLMTVIKRPGPQRTSTQFFLNGETVPQDGIEGRNTVPDIQHRRDIGAYIGKAVSWSGTFQGDIGEVIVFNRALLDAERSGLENYLGEKFAVHLPHLLQESAAQFRDDQRSFWAFQPVPRVQPPPVNDESWVRSPIDRFVLKELEARQIRPARRADKETLLRRATFGLTGLPPTPDELASYLNDESPQAWSNVIQRLLNSPHYGEQWGRHWLDVVRYAETTANDANAVMRYAYRYRDYVVDAFNRDMPYDQFVLEQLAGDLIPSTDDKQQQALRMIATGFLMVGPKALAETDKEQTRMDIVDDQLDVCGRAFLGLTLGCARCHDHKFDPILASDYYALAGIFRSTDPFKDEVRNASMWHEFDLAAPAAPGAEASPLIVMAPKEGPPKNLRIHVRGNRFQLGRQVARRVPLIFTQGRPVPMQTLASGRWELANWIADPKNPLTARVMVNRIWQQHFGRGIVATTDNFGMRGDRPTHGELLDWLAGEFVASNWSVKAMHELILSSETYQMSTVPADNQALQHDSDNRWLSRFSRRRLTAEEIRDAILSVSGMLDRRLGGNESAEILFKEAEVIDAKRGFAPNRMQSNHPFYDTPRRSIYLPVVRNAPPDSLALFDGADSNAPTAVRNDTTVASQSLYMLNNSFVRQQALALAERFLADANLDDSQRIGRITECALGRDVLPAELDTAREFLTTYESGARQAGQDAANARRNSWQAFCQALICSNEFLYLD